MQTITTFLFFSNFSVQQTNEVVDIENSLDIACEPPKPYLSTSNGREGHSRSLTFTISLVHRCLTCEQQPVAEYLVGILFAGHGLRIRGHRKLHRSQVQRTKFVGRGAKITLEASNGILNTLG